MKSAMMEAGLTPPPHLINDGTIRRFNIEGDKPRSENGWYVLYDNPAAGAFGSWKEDVAHKWAEQEYHSYTEEERAAYKANTEAAKQARAQEQARIHAECREKSKTRWNAAPPAPADHPYLIKKGIKPNGARIHNGCLILSLQDTQGNIHGLQTIAANGFKKFITGTNKKGNYFTIGDTPKDTLLLVEGYATAASIHEATGSPVVVCFDCGNMKPTAEALHAELPKTKIIIAADNDTTDGNPGLTKATEAALSIGGMLAVVKMPAGAQGSDFNDLAAVAGLEAVKDQIAAAVYPVNNEDETEHTEPIPLPAELLPVEAFNYDLLPETFKPWVRDISERMQCPPDFIAVAVMATMGAVIGRKVGIRPQDKTSWTEVPNMWSMVIGRPGVMKSPALDEAMKPLERLVAKALADFSENEKEFKIATAKADFQKEVNKKKMKVELGKDVPGDISNFIDTEEIEEPQPKRYKTNDSTPQALAELLRHNQNGVLVFRDELVSLIKGLDREDQAEGRGFYLTGWNGNSAYTSDRIGRGMNLHVPAVCLSIVGGTQPGKISEYVRHAVKGGSGDDGLIQRFGLMVWPDIDSDWENVDRYPDTKAKNEAFKVFDELDKIDPLSIGAEQDKDIDGEPEDIPYLRFSPEGQAAFLEWRTVAEPLWRGGDLPDALTSHFTKYRKLIPTIALVLHLADGGIGAVSETATIKALAWGEYLEGHARRVYGSLTSHEVTTAKAILTKIKEEKLERQFSSKDVWRPGWSRLTDSSKVESALKLLVDYQWLFEETKDTGGRPAKIYTANPAAL